MRTVEHEGAPAARRWRTRGPRLLVVAALATAVGGVALVSGAAGSGAAPQGSASTTYPGGGRTVGLASSKMISATLTTTAPSRIQATTSGRVRSSATDNVAVHCQLSLTPAGGSATPLGAEGEVDFPAVFVPYSEGIGATGGLPTGTGTPEPAGTYTVTLMCAKTGSASVRYQSGSLNVVAAAP
jgi:hypothetical protein